MARWSSSSETGLASEPACPGYAGSTPAGCEMMTFPGDPGVAADAGAGLAGVGTIAAAVDGAWATATEEAAAPFSDRAHGGGIPVPCRDDVGPLAGEDPGDEGGGGADGDGRAGVGRFRSRSSKAWATMSGTAAGSSPFSFRLYFCAMEVSMSCTTATRVSRTPSPRDATAGKVLRPQGFSAVSSSASGTSWSRSRLLYCRTRGTFSGTRRLARRLTFMFSKAVLFSLASVFWLSATKTTASAPARTTRLVALYWTCPGTV